MKASQTETVIMLTCCALQSACYSPTGIVILFILAQFQGEVQTNLTEGTRQKCAFHRARRFRMPAACALGIFSGKIICYFGFQESLRTFLKPIFTGEVVEENGSCSAAFYESAALREASSPSPSRLTPCHLSQRERPWQKDEVRVDCQGLPLWGSWQIRRI